MEMMKCKDDLIIILDSILDDYYLLWECFEDFKKYGKPTDNPLNAFIEALKVANESNYINFYIGQDFNGDEELILGFHLDTSTIVELLNFKIESTKEIRVTTSNIGIAFLEQCHANNE